MKQMLALAVRRFSHSMTEATQVIECPVPEPGPGWVRLQVHVSSLCSSDVHVAEGKVPGTQLPFVLGHEVAGVVEALGRGVTEAAEGDRVVMTPDVACGRCRSCLAGRPNICRNLTRIGFELPGGHAHYVVVPAANLIPIPDGVGFEQAALVPDAIGTMLHSVRAVAGVTVGQKVAIVGVGGLGIHGVQIARLAGAEVLAADRDPVKLEMARGLGASVVLDTRERSLEEAAMEWTGGEGLDTVLDAVGTAETVRDGLRSLARGGTLVLVGLGAAEVPVSPYLAHIKEARILGTRTCVRTEIELAMDLVRRGLVQPIVGLRTPLANAVNAIDALALGRVPGRAVLTRP